MSLVSRQQCFKMSRARAVIQGYYWLVSLFLVYVKSDEFTTPMQTSLSTSQSTTSTEPPTLPGFTKLLEEVDKSREFMRYCDTDEPIYDHDDFMNRIVSVNIEDTVFGGELREDQIVAPGIYINRNHVLTSYTPFRRIASNEKKRQIGKLYVLHYRAKWFDNPEDRNLKGYLLEREEMTCGRQIFPNSSTDYVQGAKFHHFPFYDLMVIKTQKMIDFVEDPYNFEDKAFNKSYEVVGPQLTRLASENQEIGDTIKFVSLGLIDYDHIYNRNHLHTVVMDTSERIIEECDEWFDEANRFICIRNLENHVGIGSGAFLFSGGEVIGVGCFSIQKGPDSVHVFTDVRLVLELINTTCTDFDGFPDPTTTERPKT